LVALALALVLLTAALVVAALALVLVAAPAVLDGLPLIVAEELVIVDTELEDVPAADDGDIVVNIPPWISAGAETRITLCAAFA
jgi:hypothetical protein